MKPLPFREVKRRLEAAGFVEVGQTVSHLKFAKISEAGTRTATVPKHREIAAGTLRSICDKQESAQRILTSSKTEVVKSGIK